MTIIPAVSASQSQNDSYRRGVRRVLAITLVLNIIVVIGKMTAGLIAGSLSVISDAIHSSVDSLNNIIGLIVIKYSTAGPDEGHQYGHAKFESLAAFAIAGFLLATCYEIASSAIHRLWSHTEGHPEITALTLGVMLVTIGTNVFVTLYERREGRRLKSDFLLADAIHTQSDILVSFGVLVGSLPGQGGVLLAGSACLAGSGRGDCLEWLPDFQEDSSSAGRRGACAHYENRRGGRRRRRASTQFMIFVPAPMGARCLWRCICT